MSTDPDRFWLHWFTDCHKWWINQASHKLTPAMLDWQPPGGAHTIRWLLQHISSYFFRLLHHSLDQNPSKVFTPKGGDHASVTEVIEELQSLIDQLVARFNDLSIADLESLREESSLGMIPLLEHIRIFFDHSIGHFGQIILLKAMYRRLHESTAPS